MYWGKGSCRRIGRIDAQRQAGGKCRRVADEELLNMGAVQPEPPTARASVPPLLTDMVVLDAFQPGRAAVVATSRTPPLTVVEPP